MTVKFETDNATATIFRAIMAERRAQDEKHGRGFRDVHTWCLILAEESGEVVKAGNEAIWSRDETASQAAIQDFRAELIQTAAVCWAALEDLAEIGVC